MNRMQSGVDRLEALRNTPVLAPEWPPDAEPLTFEAALEAAGYAECAQAFGKALQATQALHGMLQCPIMAVLGGLNAGKSSLVAHFLSRAGRQRIPRGEGDRQGTHRFVYWVPQRWLHDAPTRDAFFTLLDAAHGPRREYLADDPTEAECQYSSGRDAADLLQTPLIATDPELDRLRTALLDCPDIQTYDHTGPTPASRLDNPRLNFLLDAARICSAFLVVWLRPQVRDELLGRLLGALRQRVTNAPLYLLLNQIKPEPGQPTRTRNDRDVVRILEDYGIGSDACYGALHFHIPGWQELTPQPLVQQHDADQPVPQFFALSTNAPDNAPDAISAERYLRHLPRQLDMAELQQQKLHDSWNELATQVGQDLDRLQSWVVQSRDRIHTIHQGLLEFCVRKFTDQQTGEPLQIVSQEFAHELQTSFVHTAPTVVRWALKLAQPFDKAAQRARQTLALLHPFRRAVAKLDDFKLTLRNRLGITGLMVTDPQRLAEEMKAHRFVPADVHVECLEQAWRKVLQAFAEHPFHLEAADELDQVTGSLWEHMPLRRKWRVVGTSLLKSLGAMAAMAGFLTAALDGGVTLLAASSLTHTVAAAVPGLTALAGGTAGAAAAWAGFVAGAITWNTLPYLSRFFAFACDAFGVPRHLDQAPVTVTFAPQQSSYTLPEPRVPRQPTVCHLDEIRLWRPTAGFEAFTSVLRDAE